MPLVYTEEQQLLRDSASEFLAERASLAQFRSLRDEGNESGYDAEVWSEMAELGWSGIVVDEEHDGLDFGYVGAGVIMEEMGKHLSLSPFFSSAIVGATALRLAGNDAQKAALLPQAAAGELLLTLAVDEGPRHNPQGTATTARAEGDAFVLSGTKQFVLNGVTAHKLVVVARTSGSPGDAKGISLFLVDGDASGVTTSRQGLVDSHGAAQVKLDDVRVGGDALLGTLHEGMPLLQEILDVACTALSAHMLGIGQEAFNRTLTYLRERKQFGTLIGTFQGLQHRAAHLFSELEVTRSAVLKALQAMDEQLPERSVLAALAKARSGQVVRLATNEAVQMHGGIGMTDEFDIGFFMKRAQAARITYGDDNYHTARFAALNGY